MKLAFCLFKYFPYGGLGRDFLKIAKACYARGHEVHIYSMEWPGETPEGIRTTILPISGLTNRARCASFVKLLTVNLDKHRYDAVVGFNRMPGLDVYYAADVCHAADVRENPIPWLRFTPRHRLYSFFEQSVFSRQQKTEILLISEQEKNNYQHFYDTQESRLHLLPPGISKDRVRPANALEIRAEVRKELQLEESDRMLLLVGTNYKKKGLDRALLGLSALPRDVLENTYLYVLGKDRVRSWERRARRLGLGEHVRFIGLRNDISRIMLGADVLMHPAYRENTGTVLLEALVAGLPVLTTDSCGYAFHVFDAQAGIVLPCPFDQEEFDRKLAHMLSSGRLEYWSQKALEYTKDADFFSLPERAVEVIEDVASREARKQHVTS